MRDSTAAPPSRGFEIRLLNRLRFVEEDAASVNPMRHYTRMQQPGSMAGFACSDGELAADGARVSAAQPTCVLLALNLFQGHHFAVWFKGPA
jgi:hypothetical protein